MDARGLIEEIVPKGLATGSDRTLLAEIQGWNSLKGVRLILRIEELLGESAIYAGPLFRKR